MVAKVTPKVIQYQVGRCQRSTSARARTTSSVTHKAFMLSPPWR